VTHLLAALFLIVAAGEVVVIAAPLLDPALGTGRIDCSPAGCAFSTDVVRLVPETAAAQAATVKPQQVLELVAQRTPRLLLFLAGLAKRLPQALLFASLALALRRFGGAARFDAEGLVWLRRAAGFALLAVLGQPIADTLRATALSPLLTGRLEPFILFDGPPFFWGLLLAGGVWVCAWAMDEARRVESELAEIV
jgi:hypothetical protein